MTKKLLLFALIVPAAAQAETLSLHDLVGGTPAALKLLVLESELRSAEEDVERARAESGWKLSASGGYGNARDIIDEVRTREYDSIQTKVSLAYPLLGAYAREQREIELAAGKALEKRIKRDTALRVAQLEVEDVYAAYWGAQEGLEVVEAYLATESRLAGRLSGSAEDDEDSDALELLSGYQRARTERTRLLRRRAEAQARLEQMTDRPLEDLVVRGVQLPTMPALDLKRLQHDNPELAAIRAQHTSTREQLDDSVWWGIDANVDLTQTTVTDRDDNQAGNGLFANITVSMPLFFYRAGLAERRRLLAEMEGLELVLRQKSDEMIARAQDAEAEYRELEEEVNALTKRTQAYGKRLRRGGQAPEQLTRRLREYFGLALEEVQARTRYWRSHIALRSYLVVGSAEPAPEPTGPETTDVGTRLTDPIAKALASP